MNGSSFVKIMAVSLAIAGCSASGTITSGSDTSPAPAGAVPAKASAAAEGEVLRYTRAMKSPMALEIRALNGAVRATLSSSEAAEVRANKTVESGNPASQRVVVSERPEATIVCVLYADEPDAACAPGGGHRSHDDNDNDDDVRIDFELSVPAGVVLRANTLNGDVVAGGLESEIRAHTLNGALQLSSTGRIVGNTLNGNIVATTLGPGDPDPVDLATNNGQIELRLADRSAFDIDASTLSGRVTSDYPLPPPASAFGPAAIRGRVAGGGAALRMRTLNGDIQVRRVQ